MNPLDEIFDMKSASTTTEDGITFTNGVLLGPLSVSPPAFRQVPGAPVPDQSLADLVEAVRDVARALSSRTEPPAPTPNAKAFGVSYAAAATALGCSKRRVEQLLKKGVLEAAPRFGKSGRITVESLENAQAPKRVGKAPAKPSTGSWKQIDRGALRALRR